MVQQEKSDERWRLFVDGAARKNPGPAGAGIALYRGSLAIIQQGYFLGTRTNNQAEYIALLLGLCQARALMGQHEELDVYSDSELLVKQMQGLYAVKDAQLKLLHARARAFLFGRSVRFQHVMREDNTVADRLANKGIDEAVAVPSQLCDACGLGEEGKG